MTHMGMDVEQLFGSGLLTTDVEQGRLLDAARTEFVEHGFRRTSVGDIARRAEVSRPTIYRRLGDKDEIVRQVVIREVVSFFLTVSSRILAKSSPEEKAIEAFVLGMHEARHHPLMAALRQFEPETLSSFLSDHLATMEPIRAAVAMALTGESLPLDGALRAADMLIRVSASFLMVPSDSLPIDDDDQARHFARTYLPAIIAASAAGGPD
ncbi:DNA-binding transcriptional repressor AcrR [Nocardia otitidiscaviarum]|uniref:DNA-binding transcriptional repressor AcrR n=1 Tax=Nocardia otitidiscaviarum TaxID=1823 RepID=A0A379JH55_9NOCA|nr:TetR/AcrR family transcriptional regulator [Nocardia otitidiscaviarum]SUD47706.1 DNA-binding transcriptional repressor AcrR [Nocardia otitidiscaviarum]